MSARAAAIASAQAQLASAQAAYDKAKIDLDRRRKLAPNGAVSADELTVAVNAFANARANLDLARAGVEQASSSRGAAAGDLAANRALIEGTTVATNPDVLAAQGEGRSGAPRSGAHRDPRADRRCRHQPRRAGGPARGGGQCRDADRAGRPAMWMRTSRRGSSTRWKPGQRVRLVSDLYGDDVVYHGTVAGFSGGTGSAFALIPAQNATGNWIKVVQRLPVRVTLDARELARTRSASASPWMPISTRRAAEGRAMSNDEGATPALSGSKLMLAAFALALSNFMVVLDTTIANVSVPHIAGSLAISATQRGRGSSPPMPWPRRCACR